MKVGMIADFVFLKGIDHVGALACFQRPRFLADDLESGAKAFITEKLGYFEGGIIAGRQDVILGVKPENHIDLGLRLRGANSNGKGKNDSKNSNASIRYTNHREFLTFSDLGG